jgi:hypothetical protein
MIEADLDRGLTQRRVASKHKVSLSSVNAFVQWRKRTGGRGLIRPAPTTSAPLLADVPIDAPPIDRARILVANAEATLRWMQQHGSAKEIGDASRTHLQAERYLSRLVGALDVTPSQVARHPLVRQLYHLVEEILAGDINKLTRLRTGLETLVGVKHSDA